MKFFCRILIIAFTALSFSSYAQTITLRSVGKANAFMSTNMAFTARFGGNFYSLDRRGAITKTNLISGESSSVGKVSFTNAKFFFAQGGRLYVIDNDGSMTQIDPVTGNWNSVSPIGYWSLINFAIVVDNSLFMVENGAFYRYFGFNINRRKQVGDADFYNTNGIFYSDTALYCLSDDRSFYNISLATGKWTKIGKSKGWKGSWSGAVFNGKLYTVENPGVLFESSLTDGEKKQLDDTQFKKARYLFTEGGKLYTITSEGSMFEIVFGS